MTTKWDKRYLDLAYHISQWSKDPSTQVGSIIVNKHNRIVSLGFNGFPTKVNDLVERLEDRDIKLEMVVHAEANALLSASIADLSECIIYSSLFPCSRCAGLIIQSGIRKVKSPDPESIEQFCSERWKSIQII